MGRGAHLLILLDKLYQTNATNPSIHGTRNFPSRTGPTLFITRPNRNYGAPPCSPYLIRVDALISGEKRMWFDSTAVFLSMITITPELITIRCVLESMHYAEP